LADLGLISKSKRRGRAVSVPKHVVFGPSIARYGAPVDSDKAVISYYTFGGGECKWEKCVLFAAPIISEAGV
jgi:hypothetical protein